jgi:hypothetical protein
MATLDSFYCRRAVPGEREPQRTDRTGAQLRQRGLGHSVHEVRRQAHPYIIREYRTLPD